MNRQLDINIIIDVSLKMNRKIFVLISILNMIVKRRTIKFCSDGSNGKNNGLISMNSSSYMSLQLSGLQRLSQLIISAGGTNHITVDSLIVRILTKRKKKNLFKKVNICLFSIH